MAAGKEASRAKYRAAHPTRVQESRERYRARRYRPTAKPKDAPHVAWADWEKQFLIDALTFGWSDERVARELHRSVMAIQVKRCRLKRERRGLRAQ